jgi:predicted DNA-binding WGR domain protein
MARRYFEFSEGTSNKFWEVWIEGNEVRTRYGKIGTSGQVTIKDEGSPPSAQKLHDKLVREKTGKGYQEKGGSAPASSAPVEKAAKPEKVAKPPKLQQPDESDGPWAGITSAEDLPSALAAHLAFLGDSSACTKLLWALCATATSAAVKDGNLEVVFTSAGETWTLTASPPFDGDFAKTVPASHQKFCRVHNGMSLEGHEGGGLRAPYPLDLGVTGVYLRLLVDDVLGPGTSGLEAQDGGAAARRFENTEDGASKFWQISVDGSSHTVRYGKIGTDGQEKTKQFDDEDAAQADADRLIAEKTGKGYEEV